MGLRDFSLHFNQLLSVKKEILRAHAKNLVPAVDELLAAIEPEEIAVALEKINSL